MTGTPEPRPITQEEKDAASRMRDAVNLHVLAQLETGRPVAGYVMIRLTDGRSPDGVLYESRKDAFRHHPHERALFAVKVGAETMPLREAITVLQLSRLAYRNGVIFSEEEPITPHLSELLAPLMPRTMKGLGYHARGH